MNSTQLKSKALEEIMLRLGFTSALEKKNGNELWYYSPFHEENTPSFKLDTVQNVWYDHSEGYGGNCFDLLMHIKQCDFRTALRDLNALLGVDHVVSDRLVAKYKKEAKKAYYTLVKCQAIKHPALEAYLLEKRHVNLDIARLYLKEIHYTNEQRSSKKNFFAIGYQNIKKGWEFRNIYYKGCIGQKSYSFFTGSDSNNLLIFEGLMDFLSYLTEYELDQPKHDTIILNSTKHLNHILQHLADNKYQTLYTLCDNNPTGINLIASLKLMLEENEIRSSVVPCNKHYKNFEDYNDYFVKKSVLIKKAILFKDSF